MLIMRPPQINILVKTEEGHEMYFKIRKSTRLLKREHMPSARICA